MPSESNVFTRPSMLIGPSHPADNAEEIGGAAGNRTRVRSAYYRRVYRHSPGEPEPVQFRRQGLKIKLMSQSQGVCRGQSGVWFRNQVSWRLA